MKRIPVIIILILLVVPSVRAAEVAVLVSGRLNAYEEAYNGFKEGFVGTTSLAGPKAVMSNSIKEFYLTDPGVANDIDQMFFDARPDVIVAIGAKALDRVRSFKDIPVIYLLVPNPGSEILEEKNITGVEMDISAARQLGALTRTVPGVKRVGVVCSPGRSRELINKARTYGWSEGLVIVAREISKSRDFGAVLADMKNKVDAIWMVPDRRIYVPQNVELLFLFSLENQIPVLTFSEKYLNTGAVVSVSIAPYGMGQEAGQRAAGILTGVSSEELKVRPVDSSRVTVNHRAVRKIVAAAVHRAPLGEK
ncbi:MAG: hypothetical protein KAI35_03435 [Desulfobulbaceae bacterium]|nr:hypothetical protein [Desulfobulbaceae bacterium]